MSLINCSLMQRDGPGDVQSVTHVKRSQVIQPMGGVLASPLSRLTAGVADAIRQRATKRPMAKAQVAAAAWSETSAARFFTFANAVLRRSALLA